VVDGSGAPGSARALSIAGIVLGLLSVVLLPVVVGPAAAVCGYLGQRNGDRLGTWSMGVAVVGMIVGLVLQGLFTEGMG
jgi:hypothetical protein